MPNLISKYWQEWEHDFSTRTSLFIWDKPVPVDVTLTTAGTAQDLYRIAPNIPTLNIATNPSFETGAPPTGYTAVGAALAQSAAQARTGSNSMQVTPNNLAVGEGFFWLSPAIGSSGDPDGLWKVVSAYFRRSTGSGSNAKIRIANTSGVMLSEGNVITLDTTWRRSTAAFKLSESTQYRVYFITDTQHATVFFVDSFQGEIRGDSNVTDYCDGSLGLFYEWDSTAHASTSRRRIGPTAIRGYNLHVTRDAYIAYDVIASSTTGRFTRAGSDIWIDHPVNIRKFISFINANAGETPRIYGDLFGVHTGQRSD